MWMLLVLRIEPADFLKEANAMSELIHANTIEGCLERGRIKTDVVHLFDDGTEKYGPALQRRLGTRWTFVLGTSEAQHSTPEMEVDGVDGVATFVIDTLYKS